MPQNMLPAVYKDRHGTLLLPGEDGFCYKDGRLEVTGYLLIVRVGTYYHLNSN